MIYHENDLYKSKLIRVMEMPVMVNELKHRYF